jgi:hypothetical protein|tara:strand:- start:1591 stop:1722 length:132 start_codon:yes stop_codon:yes gene_type:complete
MIKLKDILKEIYDENLIGSKHKKDLNDENFGYNSKGELKMLDI